MMKAQTATAGSEQRAGAAPAGPAGGGRGPTGIYGLALALTVGIVGLLLVDNWHYIFHARLYESSDWASDSLFVREAKEGALLHGHYSRWNFYHPGPVLFYVMALGEWLFYDRLHLVHTPFNGQTLAVWIAVALFFSLAVAIFAKRLGRARGGYSFFLPLALLFAVWHYGAAESVHAFEETWPVCPPILVFLCFLAAAASVGSGGGGELPILALAGGWLVHNYIAQPLFVVPLTLTAYAGLLRVCRRPGPAGAQGRTLAAGWRAFPRAHLAAGVILGLFLLPLLLDALRGGESNLSHILAYLHRQKEPPKSFGQSLGYFLTFGSYGAYDAQQPQFFAGATAAGMRVFLALHWRAYLSWAAALLAPPLLWAAVWASTPDPGAAGGGAAPTDGGFLRWFYGMVAGAAALTLVWGMKQTGEMYYFNAYFNYSIYYGVALGLAAALAGFLHTLTAAPALAPARALLAAALWLGAGAAAADHAAQFQARTLDFAADRAAAGIVAQAARTLPPGAVCYLDCEPWSEWPAAIAVVLQLERLGCKARVSDNLATMYGSRRTISREPLGPDAPVVHWQVRPLAGDPVRLGRWPVLLGCGLAISEIQELDPAGGSIRFAKEGNYLDYAAFGWTPTETDWTWSDQREALLQFRPLPLPPAAEGKGVDVILHAWCFASPTRPVAQRVEVVFNGVALPAATLSLTPDQNPARIHLDAAAWSKAVAKGRATLLFRFPDAKSPASVGMNDDVRPLGGGFRSVEFRPAE